MSSGSRSPRNLRGIIEIVSSDELATTTVLNITGALSSKGNILPDAASTYDLGSPSLRWDGIYANGLHLANERGDWTVVEEVSYLTIKNNKNGKRYKLLMEELPEDED